MAKKRKRITLDETWRNCLSMWRWIYKQTKNNPRLSQAGFKVEWLAKHGFPDNILHNCFFCNYAVQCPKSSGVIVGKGCDSCPARKFDKSFICTDLRYHFNDRPIAFYNKLVSLDRKRKAGK